jgi:hypothetical protein
MVNQQPSAAAGGAGGEGAGFASVPMPVQVASVPPSVAPSSAAAAPSAADAAAAAAGAAAGGGGRGGDEMEALIGATLQRMAEQLDVLTVRNAQRTAAQRRLRFLRSTMPRRSLGTRKQATLTVLCVLLSCVLVLLLLRGVRCHRRLVVASIACCRLPIR